MDYTLWVGSTWAFPIQLQTELSAQLKLQFKGREVEDISVG